MSGRQRLGGLSASPSAAQGRYAPRDSIPSEYLSPRGGVSQTLRDVAKIVFVAILVFAVGLLVTGFLLLCACS